MSRYEQAILEHISGVVAEAGGPAVTRDTRLLEAGLLDSISLVQLVQFLEARFGIRIPDEDVGPELFETPASVAAYVAARAN
jgi:acyl carrier protein